MSAAAALVRARKVAPESTTAAPVAADGQNGRASPRDRPGRPGVRYLRGATASAISFAVTSSGFFLPFVAMSATIAS